MCILKYVMLVICIRQLHWTSKTCFLLQVKVPVHLPVVVMLQVNKEWRLVIISSSIVLRSKLIIMCIY